MSSDPPSLPDGLQQALEEYLTLLEQGSPLDKEEFLERYPNLRAPLREYLNHLDLLHQAAALSSSRKIVAPEEAPTDDHVLAEVGQSQREFNLGQLGDYRLLREIGRGGMGIVYEAQQISLNRKVALKVLPFAADLDSRQLQRFRTETLVAAGLDHPHIVPVYGMGQQRGFHFYAMRFIPGLSLDQILRRLDSSADEPDDHTESTLSLPECPILKSMDRHGRYRLAARVGAEVAEALAYAHEEGVIHRDIKPSNVLVDHDGKAWVTDFGLARMGQESNLTQTGDLVGTPRYMSPEQARGQRVIDHRSDIYSLAATLYEVITLHPAAAGEDRSALLHQILFEDLTRPRRVDGTIPPELEAIVLKGLAREIDQRYATAQELAEDLRRFLDGQPVRAQRWTWRRQVGRWVRRHARILTGVGLALVVVFALVSGVLLFANVRIQKALQDRTDALTAKSEALEDLQAKERERIHQLGLARLAEAQGVRLIPEPGRRLRAWKALQEASRNLQAIGELQALQQTLRNEAAICLALPDLDLREIEVGQAPIDRKTRWSPTFTHYAQFDSLPVLRVYRANDHTEVAAFPCRDPRGWASCYFSPDGRYLVVQQRDGKGYVYALEAKTLVCQWQGILNGGEDFRPDSRAIAVAKESKQVVVFELSSGRVLRTLNVTGTNLMRYNPEGTRLAITYQDRPGIAVWDVGTARRMTGVLTALRSPANIDWSPDGRWLAVGCRNGTIHTWDLLNNRSGPRMSKHEKVVTALRWHPQGEHLLSCSHDNTIRLWNAHTGQQNLVYRAHLFTCSADGLRMRTVNTQGKLAEGKLVGTPCLRTLAVAVRPSLTFLADGTLLAFTTSKGAVIADAKTGTQLAILPGKPAVEVLVDSRQRALITVGPGGAQRWPIGSGKDAHTLRIGPPESLSARPFTREVWDEWESAYLAPDGSMLLYTTGPFQWVFVKPGSSAQVLAGNPRNGFRNLAISPNGEIFGHRCLDRIERHHEVVRWEKPEALPRGLPLGKWGRYSRLCVSPDGQLLVRGTREFYDVYSLPRVQKRGTIACERGVYVAIAIAPDSRLAAVSNQTAVRLVDLRTLRTLVDLPLPEGDHPLRLQYSPGADTLAIVTYRGRLYLWDIRRLRAELATLGVDWDLPPTPKPAQPHIRTIEVQAN